MIHPYGQCTRRVMCFSLKGLDSLLKGEFFSKQRFFSLHGTSGRKRLFENKHPVDNLVWDDSFTTWTTRFETG